MGISGGVLWSVPPSTTIHEHHETIGKSLEGQRHPMFCLRGQHHCLGPNRGPCETPFGHFAGDFDNGINLKKSILTPCQVLTHQGFVLDLKEGFLRVPPEKLKGVRRELGKLVTHQQMTPGKMAAILGQVRSFLVALPFLRAIIDQMAHFVGLHRYSGGGLPTPLARRLGSPDKRSQALLRGLARKGFCQNPTRAQFTFRFKQGGLGRFGCPVWDFGPILVAQGPRLAHQCKGAQGSRFHCA